MSEPIDEANSGKHSNLFNHKGTAKHGDVAHISGGGPAGTWCKTCISFTDTGVRKPSGKGWCAKAAEMRRVSMLDLKPIKDWTASCKYYVAKPEKKEP